MDAQLGGERLLAQPVSRPVGEEIQSHRSLKLTLGHCCTMDEVLLEGLQTYKYHCSSERPRK